VLSPENVQPVSFGSKSIDIGNNTVVTVPVLTRKRIRNKLYQSYIDLQPTPPVSRGAFLRICTLLTSTDQKAKAGLDNHAVEYGSENFELIKELVNNICPRTGMNTAFLLKLVDDVESYYKVCFFVLFCEDCLMLSLQVYMRTLDHPLTLILIFVLHSSSFVEIWLGRTHVHRIA